MKTIPWFAGLALLLTACGSFTAVEQPDFSLNMTLTDEEVSMDSNSTTSVITVNGYEGNYQWTYDGYHPDENFDTEREYSFTLSNEELHDLELLIRENGLLVDREAAVPTGEPWSAFEVTWNVSIGEQSAVGHVVGDPLEWEGWNANDHDTPPEDESFFAAQQVDSFLREKVGFSY